MGLRMDYIHAPTIASGPTSQPTADGTSKKQTLPELSAQKENLEAELSALSSVLDSVSSGCENNTSSVPR
jgi:26S proteasome non-ATPase regulatory subunit 9